jgi:methylamine dehydrogenase accessory protein MauD
MVLAIVFVVAGVAKLADLRGSQAALRGFGVPRLLADVLGVLLPLGELAIAGALVPAVTGRMAALAAFALLLVFAAAIGIALVRGRKPDCHCFGQLHSAPAGWRTLARNAALAGLAIVGVFQPATNPSTLELAAFAAIAVMAGQALVSIKLLRRYGRALQRIEALEAGTPERQALGVGAEAPAFALPTVGGGEVSLEGLLARARPVLLVFTDPGCGPCHALLPDLTRWQHEHADQTTLALVSRGDEAENAGLAEEHDLDTVLVQEDHEVAERYGAYATPSAVLVGTDGLVARGVVAGANAIEELVRSVVPPPVPVAEPASNGVAKVATAAALAGGLAVAATAAEAAPDAAAQQPSDPELQTIMAMLKKAEPRIVKTAERAQRAVRAQATLVEDAAQRRKRAVAVRALAAQRKEVLALRAELAKFEPVGAAAHSVRVLSLHGLSLLAQSVRKHERALVATPGAAARLLDDSQDTLLRALLPFISAAEYMRRG